jgi:hypothetical protein
MKVYVLMYFFASNVKHHFQLLQRIIEDKEHNIYNMHFYSSKSIEKSFSNVTRRIEDEGKNT